MYATAEQLPQTHELDRRQRIETDTTTWLAETLHGSMRTSFEFSFDGVELYGKDGRALGAIFDDAITEARMLAEQNPSLLFELRRRLIEKGEYEDMLRMARGELPNTMVVVSDFPPELMAASQDVGGYNTSRRQTMLRSLTRQPGGSMRITVQSLDGSNRQAQEAIYTSLGERVKTGELLGQRIYRELPTEWQDNVINNLTSTYDESLRQQYGGAWHAGIRQTPQRAIADTYAFAVSQHDLIDWFTEQKLANPQGAEELRYKLAAAMEARYERHVRRTQARSIDFIPGAVSFRQIVSVERVVSGRPNLIQELQQAETRALRLGKTYSGCGATVSGMRRGMRRRWVENEDETDELGYGNKSLNGSKKEKGVMRCVNCPKCRTYHEELRAKDGVFKCKNKDCGHTAKA